MLILLAAARVLAACPADAATLRADAGAAIAAYADFDLDLFRLHRTAGPGPSVPLAEGWLFVDGESGARRIPVERAAVVQHSDSGGRVRSWYLAGGPLPADLPGLRAAAAPATEEGRGSRKLLAAGGVTGGVALLSLVVSARAETAFWDTRSEARADRLYRANRFFGFTGAGLSVASGAFVAGALIQGEW